MKSRTNHWHVNASLNDLAGNIWKELTVGGRTFILCSTACMWPIGNHACNSDKRKPAGRPAIPKSNVLTARPPRRSSNPRHNKLKNRPCWIPSAPDVAAQIFRQSVTPSPENGRKKQTQNNQILVVRLCLVSHSKNFHPSHRIFRHMHRTLNIDKK